MKIKMIGTGALSVKQRSSCLLIDDKILIDCGNGIVKTLLEQNVDINKIDTLLITHLHGDRFLDIPFLIMQRGFISATNNLLIYCPIGTEEVVGEIIALTYSDVPDWTILRDKANVKFIEFESLNNEEITDGYFVNSYQVIHGNFKPAYGYVLKNNNKSIGISGDSSYCDSIEKIVEQSDISILDMSFIDSSDKHMGINDIEKLIKKYNKPIITTHMSQPVKEYAIEKKINNLIVPDDGEEFQI